jgi:predicted transcriptional regulator
MRQARPPKEIPPPLELECLKALWQIGEASVRSVQAQVENRRKLAYTTVMTLLERLARKGTVSRRKQGRIFLYSAVADREALRRKALDELMDSLFDGSRELMLGYMHDDQPPAPAAQEEAPERLDAALL